MEKQWNKIKECPLADGLRCMSNRAKETVMNKSYCTLSGQKELIIIIIIQWRYSPRGPWPTERPPPVSEASANFCG